MTEQELIKWLSKHDPQHIDWIILFEENGWTESLVREYCACFSSIDWMLLSNFHGRLISLNFAREFKEQLKGKDEELYYFGKLI